MSLHGAMPAQGARSLRIGFLDENSHDECHSLMSEGVFEAAAAHGAQVVRIGHFTANDTTRDPFQIRALHRFVSQFRLDGLLFTGWCRAVTLENEKAFRKAFADMPLFSVGRPFEGIPTAWFDGNPYLEELLHHLLHRHGCRRIAFIEPFTPDGRADTYRRMMQRMDCSDEALFIEASLLTGLSVPERGRHAVEILLDERKVRPDALVSLYNTETEAVLKELGERGIRVPEDMAVTSYEDGELGRYGTPAYTTVHFPWRELGRVSCDLFLSRLMRMRTEGRPTPAQPAGLQEQARWTAGAVPVRDAEAGAMAGPQAVRAPAGAASFPQAGGLASVLGLADVPGGSLPMDVRVPGRFIVRESCGCLKQEMSNLPVMTASQKTLLDMSEHEWLSLADLAEETLQHRSNARLPDMRTLMKGFVRGLRTGNRGLFLQAVESQLDTLRGAGDAGEPDPVTEMMRSVVLPHAGKMPNLLLAAEDMFLQAATLLSERSLRAWGERERVVRRTNLILEEAGRRIVGQQHPEGLFLALEGTLAALGIRSCLVALVDRTRAAESVFATCTQAFRMQDGVRLEAEQAPEPAEPVGVVLERYIGAADAPNAIVANLLFTDKDFMGFALYGKGPSDERVYRALSYHLSVSLDGIHLSQTLERSVDRLVENARREGADSRMSGVLAGLREQLHAMEHAAASMREVLRKSPLDEFVRISNLLGEQPDLEDFLTRDPRAARTLRTLAELRRPLATYRDAFGESLRRMQAQSRSIRDTMDASRQPDGSGAAGGTVSVEGGTSIRGAASPDGPASGGAADA